MDRRDLEQIDTFLGMVGKATLFDYYGLQTKAPAAELEAAIKKRRSWAQGQQANPKYRNEALWLIKNNALIKRVLVEQRAAYIEELGSRSESKNLEVLTLFIKGTLAGGMLTPDAERAIQQQGRAMGLDDASIRARIDQLLDETGASRQSSSATADAPTSQAFVDFYAILDVDKSATLDEIEASHRAKYRWARTLKDKDRVTELYAQLDEAWRVLKDPMRRAAYDAQYEARKSGKKVAGSSTDDIIGFLPSPGGQPARPKPTPPKPTPPKPRSRPTPPPPKPPSKKRKPTPPPPPQVKSPGLRLSGEGAGGDSGGRREPPSPPPAVKGRTIGLGGGRRARNDSPRLAIASPEVLSLKVGGSPQSHTVVIKNAGTGKMPGRVSTDRDWIEVSTSRLDPAAAHQEVEVTIHPSRMRRPRGTALVTVVTDHGERKAITINVERRSALVPALAAGGVLAVALGVVGAWYTGLFDGEDSGTSRGMLVVEVDPSSDSITLDGETVGAGGRIELDSGFAIGRPLQLETALSGFLTDQREVIVPRGETLTVQVHLELDESQLTKPGSGMKRASRVDHEAFAQALRPRQSHIESCLQGVNGLSEATARQSVDIYWGATGNLLYLDAGDANFSDPGAIDCLRRELRATQLPLLDGDYAVVEDHLFEVAASSE